MARPYATSESRRTCWARFSKLPAPSSTLARSAARRDADCLVLHSRHSIDIELAEKAVERARIGIGKALTSTTLACPIKPFGRMHVLGQADSSQSTTMMAFMGPPRSCPDVALDALECVALDAALAPGRPGRAAALETASAEADQPAKRCRERGYRLTLMEVIRPRLGPPRPPPPLPPSPRPPPMASPRGAARHLEELRVRLGRSLADRTTAAVECTA